MNPSALPIARLIAGYTGDYSRAPGDTMEKLKEKMDSGQKVNVLVSRHLEEEVGSVPVFDTLSQKEVVAVITQYPFCNGDLSYTLWGRDSTEGEQVLALMKMSVVNRGDNGKKISSIPKELSVKDTKKSFVYIQTLDSVQKDRYRGCGTSEIQIAFELGRLQNVNHVALRAALSSHVFYRKMAFEGDKVLEGMIDDAIKTGKTETTYIYDKLGSEPMELTPKGKKQLEDRVAKRAILYATAQKQLASDEMSAIACKEG